MNLSINNFAKIKSANFSINGITVIVGNNNMGKSTVGKVVASIFNSFLNIQTKVSESRTQKMASDVQKAIYGEIPSNYLFPPSFYFEMEQNAAKTFLQATSDDERINVANELGALLKQKFYNKNSRISEEKIATIVYETFEKSIKISDKKLEEQIVSIYFQRVFNQQINNVLTPFELASLCISVKGENIEIGFKNNEVKNIKHDFYITHSATYIDNPFIIDKLNQSLRTREIRRTLSSLELDLLDKLQPKEVENIGMAAIEQLETEKALKEVTGRLNSVIPGNIELKDRFVYDDKKGHALDLNSLSTGLKSFAVIKQLLFNNSLKNKDVLVLDEPEIHLHPDWQLKYAEIIVLLQKVFNLNIIITTHSPHFLEAIDMYSKIHGLKDKCNYYFSKEDKNEFNTEFSDVTKDVRPIYTSLVEPNLRIDQIKAHYPKIFDEE